MSPKCSSEAILSALTEEYYIFIGGIPLLVRLRNLIRQQKIEDWLNMNYVLYLFQPPGEDKRKDYVV
jgi:hypothetical protein